MTTGALLLAGFTLVTIGDVAVAIYFRSLADRVENGETVSASIDPPNARRMANLLLVFAPLLWVIMALVSLGVIPSGIDPIKF